MASRSEPSPRRLQRPVLPKAAAHFDLNEHHATKTGQLDIKPSDEIIQRIHLQILLSRQVTITPASWHFQLNSPFWRLYVNKRSGAEILYQGKHLALRSDRIYLIPAWLGFQTQITRPVTQYYIHFHLGGFSPSLQRRVFTRPLVLRPHALLSALCKHWQHGLESSPSLAGLEWTFALVHAALAEAMELISEEEREVCLRWLSGSSEVLPAIECISRRLSHPPSNPELAALCGISLDHFIWKFRHATDMTPARYGLERRITVAAQWLAGTTHTLDEIAVELGFADRFHFSRSFKKLLGISPAAYRHMHTRQRNA